MLIDTIFDRFVRRLRISRRQQTNKPSPNSRRMKTKSRKSSDGRGESGIFDGANNFVVKQPVFLENRGQIVQNFAAGKADLHPVLENIAPHVNFDAAMDSSARFPPPLCHPQTRLGIRDRLSIWFDGPKRRWNMIWLHGPAGTGKSAVAQTFAERCAENERLGASFFFSRPNDRNDPDTVIPSLVYQLAVCNPDYKSLVAAQLASDPGLLRKTRRTQFKKLIVEPFSLLQSQGCESIREPLLVVLDGLDECRGESAQREFLEMISEVVQLKRNFPLLWLICSRPEPHLKYLFSRADFTVDCGREELAIDAESIADVDLYLLDGLEGIKMEFEDVTTPTWPPEAQVTELLGKASGHFAFASTSLRYIGDPTFAVPMSQLDALLSFLRGVRAGASNPMEPLDALYTRILKDVPDQILPITKRILGYSVFDQATDYKSTQELCSFLHIDQVTFYSAFRKLHSVIDVPSPEAASERWFQFYHASFQDYLCDPGRSGEFVVEAQDYSLDFAKSCLSWHETDLELFHATDGRSAKSHKHGVLPDLKWTSDNNAAEISLRIADRADKCWVACSQKFEWDEALLSQIQDFDFRHARTEHFDNSLRPFVNRLWEVQSSNGFIRTEPQNEVDLQLLEYMKSMTESEGPVKPASFPLTWITESQRVHFLFGHDSKTVLFWTSGHMEGPWFDVLTWEEASSKERMGAYHAWLTEIKQFSEQKDSDDETEEFFPLSRASHEEHRLFIEKHKEWYIKITGRIQYFQHQREEN